MRPVTFKWKGRDENDFGFIAEEMATVNPLFVTYKDGKIEGVKYPQLTAVLVGALHEMQKQRSNELVRLQSLQGQYENQSTQIKLLKTAVRDLEQQISVRTARK